MRDFFKFFVKGGVWVMLALGIVSSIGVAVEMYNSLLFSGFQAFMFGFLLVASVTFVCALILLLLYLFDDVELIKNSSANSQDMAQNVQNRSIVNMNATIARLQGEIKALSAAVGTNPATAEPVVSAEPAAPATQSRTSATAKPTTPATSGAEEFKTFFNTSASNVSESAQTNGGATSDAAVNKKLDALLKSGIITQAEYDAMVKK